MRPRNRTLALVVESGLRSAHKVGAYVNLLAHHSAHGKLPADSEALREIAGVAAPAGQADPWKASIWPAIRHLFRIEDGDIHPRVPGEKRPAAEAVPCSRDTMRKVMEAWNALMPELPAAQIASDDRYRRFAERWREASKIPTSKLPHGYSTEEDGLVWWSGFMQFMRGSDFLMGRKIDFRATFDFILQPGGFRKILEGHYR